MINMHICKNEIYVYNNITSTRALASEAKSCVGR